MAARPREAPSRSHAGAPPGGGSATASPRGRVEKREIDRASAGPKASANTRQPAAWTASKPRPCPTYNPSAPRLWSLYVTQSPTSWKAVKAKPTTAHTTASVHRPTRRRVATASPAPIRPGHSPGRHLRTASTACPARRRPEVSPAIAPTANPGPVALTAAAAPADEHSTSQSADLTVGQRLRTRSSRARPGPPAWPPGPPRERRVAGAHTRQTRRPARPGAGPTQPVASSTCHLCERGLGRRVSQDGRPLLRGQRAPPAPPRMRAVSVA